MYLVPPVLDATDGDRKQVREGEAQGVAGPAQQRPARRELAVQRVL